jgi:hypothetical protein
MPHPLFWAGSRLQSNYDLAVSRGTVGRSREAFASFAEHETVYFINF